MKPSPSSLPPSAATPASLPDASVPPPPARKILRMTHGIYEDYRETWFYAPATFTWSQLATALKKRKYALNPKARPTKAPDTIVDEALRAVGCVPVPIDLEINIDNFHLNWEEDETVTYGPANDFIAKLEQRPM